jgi:hypothetical protein
MKAARGEMSHLLIDRFRFDSFVEGREPTRLLTRFGDLVKCLPILPEGQCRHFCDVPCVDGSELARAFFTFAALVGAAMCSAFRCGSHDRWP